jgi:hypothetical protein
MKDAPMSKWAFSVAAAKAPSLGAFERYLTVWVALCMAAGVALGQAVPGLFHALGAATVAQVNLPVAGLVWLLKIDLAALGEVRTHWRGIAVTVVPALPARRTNRRLYRRADSACGGALHGDGVCLVEPR